MYDGQSNTNVRCSVLLQHFAQVLPLQTFVRQRFGIEVAASSSKQACGLSDEQWKRLTGTLIGTDLPVSDAVARLSDGHRQDRGQSSSHTTIHEAVQDAQLQILSNTFTRSSSIGRTKQDASDNILLRGYRRPDDRLESFRLTSTGRPGLINLYPNSMVTSLVLGREWHHLFERIGADNFIWLLVHTSMFVPLVRHGADGTCFVQLTGSALSERLTTKAQAAAAHATHEPSVEHVDSAQGLRQSRKRLKRKHNATNLDTPDQPMATTSGPTRSAKLGKRAKVFERVDSRNSVRSIASSADRNSVGCRTSAALSRVNRKPSEIVFVRSRIFYARCSRNKSGRVEVGLPSVHVLVRSGCAKELDKALPSSTASSSNASRSKSVARTSPSGRSGDRKQHLRSPKSQEAIFHERRTRHLAKYVFPRHFGLHNVFTGARDFDTTTQPFRDYTVREVEIKALGAIRTPKTLRPVLPVLAKILARHDRLNYLTLLDRCCPSRVPKGRLTAQERQQIVEDLAEVDILQPSTGQDTVFSASQKQVNQIGKGRQALVLTTLINVTRPEGHTVKARTKSEVGAPALPKPRYTNYAVPTAGQVARFVTLVLNSLLPRDVFGSLHNQKLVLATIGDFVRLRRYESFNLHQIAQSFRFTDVEWALPAKAASRNRRPTRQEEEARKKLVLELLYWLFDGLVIPLLRTTFYITETAAYRNRVLFFRQDDWHVLSKPVMGQLKESIFEPLTRAEALSMMSSRKLGYSHVRLLPKETGVRPIVNLRRRSTKQVHIGQQVSQPDGGKARSRTRSGAKAALMSAKKQSESLILGQSINYILQSVFHILTYEKKQFLTGANLKHAQGLGNDHGKVDADMLSSSIFGPNEIYTQVKTFKQRLMQDKAWTTTAAKKKLYFVKVDVRCAFDSIDQGKLLEIIEKILCKGCETGPDGYRIHRFAKVMPSAVHEAKSSVAGQNVAASPQLNGTKREFVRLARPDCEHIDFFDLASSLAVSLHDVVFVDSVSYRYESTSLVLKLLRQHITENLIKVGKEFYRQRVGIPQGSSLSTLLCSFFYADMEAQDPFLRSLRTGSMHGKRSLLMRYTDDFLLITTSKRQAKQFYNVMRRGHPEYGCFISAEKTLVNFDMLDTGGTSALSAPLIPRTYGTEFPWCGLTISTKDLGVSTDLTRYAGIDIRDTLTVEYCRRPGGALVEKMIQSVKSRCHILFTDTALNGERRAYANIYSSFLVAALKFRAYLGELRRFKLTFPAEYLFKAIQRLVRFTSRYIGSRAASAKAKLKALATSENKGGSSALGRKGRKRRAAAVWRVSCAIQPHNVDWLGYSAFLVVLSNNNKERRDAREANNFSQSFHRHCLDPETRQLLVSRIETNVQRSSHSASRRKMRAIAIVALKEARKSLKI